MKAVGFLLGVILVSATLFVAVRWMSQQKVVEFSPAPPASIEGRSVPTLVRDLHNGEVESEASVSTTGSTKSSENVAAIESTVATIPSVAGMEFIGAFDDGSGEDEEHPADFGGGFASERSLKNDSGVPPLARRSDKQDSVLTNMPATITNEADSPVQLPSNAGVGDKLAPTAETTELESPTQTSVRPSDQSGDDEADGKNLKELPVSLDGDAASELDEVAGESSPLRSELKQFVFWSPFVSRFSARGFAESLTIRSGIPIEVVKSPKGYRMALRYRNDIDLQAQIAAIEETTRLRLH